MSGDAGDKSNGTGKTPRIQSRRNRTPHPRPGVFRPRITLPWRVNRSALETEENRGHKVGNSRKQLSDLARWLDGSFRLRESVPCSPPNQHDSNQDRARACQLRIGKAEGDFWIATNEFD